MFYLSISFKWYLFIFKFNIVKRCSKVNLICFFCAKYVLECCQTFFVRFVRLPISQRGVEERGGGGRHKWRGEEKRARDERGTGSETRRERERFGYRERRRACCLPYMIWQLILFKELTLGFLKLYSLINKLLRDYQKFSFHPTLVRHDQMFFLLESERKLWWISWLMYLILFRYINI